MRENNYPNANVAFQNQTGRRNESVKRQREADKWAGIWQSKLCRFHNVPSKTDWNYSADQVIKFLKDRVKRGEPAWKRLKIIDALIRFRKLHPVAAPSDLAFIQRALRERAAIERTSGGNRGDESSGPDRTIPEAELVGKINPREPIPLQLLRRKLRLMGKAFNTEKAYVKWTRRFLMSRNALDADSYSSVKKSDVEAC